ncbi:Crp/Fnr family transcriptional regulator [Secundilactobacillus odoratitofui]|uniref:Crp/Fnr family transcriptional regulator n=1 Tax=Secundilactobacillus odoratitofui TaxID=480930 RepID=UPI0006D05B0A|nr:cyclic nucleotide-binding domain-containing protein [Secundilactobacillus odoratitofui]
MNRTDEVEKYRTFISQQPEFSALSSAEFDQLTTTLRIKSFGKGQVLFDQGDTRDRLYYVLEGVVRLERLDETGNFPFINYVSPYKAFPYRGFFSR